MPTLNTEETKLCDLEISENECWLTLNKMSKNKAPGPDGFPAEFYITFWGELKSLFLSCIKYSIVMGELSPTQSQGIITLIPKKGKNPLSPSSYRPITLLNCDYKLISKLVNNRMKRFLKTLTHSDQSGFVKGRYIGDNIRLLFDIIDYTEFKHLPGAVLFVDFFKAFDSLKWKFLFKVLKKYGFSLATISMVKLLYKNSNCRIINNNFLSNHFDICKGVRQGDPLSPTLFILSIECLAISLRNDRIFRGIKIENHCCKLSLFADDLTIYLNGNLHQFERVFMKLDIFALASGCKVNLQKSQAIYLGSNIGKLQKPFENKGLNWPSTEIKYLGVNIPINNLKSEKNLLALNSNEFLPKAEALLNIWSSRGLSLLGKITVIKCLLLPMVVFKILVLPVFPPKDFTKKLTRILYWFIWGSNWERVSRQKLCNGIEHGGAKMVDVEKYFLSLKAKWINTFLDDNFVSQWKIVESTVKTPILNCVISSNLNIEHVQIKKLIPFRTLRNLIITMQKLYSYTCLCEPIQNKPLWLNKLVRLNKAVLYNEEFVNAGIVDYGHLINSAGEILDYGGVTEKFHIPRNNSSFIEFIKLCAAIPSCWEDNKNYQLPDNHDHLSAFRSALNNITFSTKWIYICLREFNIVEPIKQQEL